MTKKNLIDKLEKVDNHFNTAKFHSFINTKDLPKQGGVYCIYKDNQTIYIGITDNIRRRINNFINEFKIPLDKKDKAERHSGAHHIQEKYPDSAPIDYKFKYFIENDLNLYNLYERYLICQYQLTILNKK